MAPGLATGAGRLGAAMFAATTEDELSCKEWAVAGVRLPLHIRFACAEVGAALSQTSHGVTWQHGNISPTLRPLFSMSLDHITHHCY